MVDIICFNCSNDVQIGILDIFGFENFPQNSFEQVSTHLCSETDFNPIALKMAKTLWSFGHFECNRVNKKISNTDTLTDCCSDKFSGEATLLFSFSFRIQSEKVL